MSPAAPIVRQCRICATGRWKPALCAGWWIVPLCPPGRKPPAGCATKAGHPSCAIRDQTMPPVPIQKPTPLRTCACCDDRTRYMRQPCRIAEESGRSTRSFRPTSGVNRLAQVSKWKRRFHLVAFRNPNPMWISCCIRQTHTMGSAVCVLWEQCLPRFIIQHRLEGMRRFQCQCLLHGRAL